MFLIVEKPQGRKNQRNSHLANSIIEVMQEKEGALCSDVQGEKKRKIIFEGMHVRGTCMRISWRIQVGEKGVSWKVSTVGGGGVVGISFCETVATQYQQICQFINLINCHHLPGDGTFSVRRYPPSLTLTLHETNLHLFCSKQKIIKYLRFRIAKLTSIFQEQIWNLVEYYKLEGWTGREGSTGEEIGWGDECKKIADRISNLKEHFEMSRQVRAKRTGINLRLCHNKIVTQVLATFTGRMDQLARYARLDTTKLYQTKQSFNSFKEEVLNSPQPNNIITVVVPIKIDEIYNEQPLKQGGYGALSVGKYKVMFGVTMNPQGSKQKINMFEFSAMSVDKHGNRESQKHVIDLVKKSKLNRQFCPALQNQINLLKLVRNSRCKSLANYYLQFLVNENFHDKHSDEECLFLRHYPAHLAEHPLRFSQKMRAMFEVGLGLHFLSEYQIVHRDLKPNNIMVDWQKHAKIIDFGSCAPVYGSKKLSVADIRLRSTQGYYISYSKLSGEYHCVFQKYTREQFQTNKAFDLFSYGQILQDLFSLTMLTENSYIRNNLKYLSLKCKEINPDDRPRHDEVIFFMKCLQDYETAKKAFWERGTMQYQREENQSIATEKSQFPCRSLEKINFDQSSNSKDD